MPCKIQIEKNLTEEVDRMSLEGLSYPLEEAEKVAKKVNNLFNANVVRFYRIGDIVDRAINIPKSLIDKYYDNEKRLEEQEARRVQEEDAARAGVEYDDRYLFSLDNPNQEELEFNVNTLNRVIQFLEEIGVSQRFIPEFLDQYGSVVEGAIAAANFIDGTVDIIDDVEKRPAAWDKLPEEAAHFWYRLLKEDSPLKKMLWESHEAALKADELYKGKYGKLPGINSAQDLTEEAIGQLIAEAIKRIESKNASKEDYSFFKKFLEWINSILNTFKTIDENPFEVAAMKILSSDVSDLMTFQEYKNLTDIVYFDTVLDNQSVAPVDYTLIEDIGEVFYPFLDEDNFYFNYKDGRKSPEFRTLQELDVWVVANIPQIIKRQEEKNQQIIDNQRFVDRLLNKTFRKRTKFLPKTLRKYFHILDSRFSSGYPFNKFEPEGAEITRKLSPKEKEILQKTLGYTNVTPTLKVLPLILQKYKKNPISLSEKLKVDGIKKEESAIIENIKDLIKAENPDRKSITAEELVNEVHTFLETNFMLGFANEEQYLDYRVGYTFEKTDDVLHNKISIRFNDKSHIQRNIKGSTHFARFSYGALPAAWANLTYFYNKSTEKKDAVLLHEIQSDIIEFLRSFNVENLNIDNLLDSYLYKLSQTLTDNLRAIENSEIKIDKTGIEYVMRNLFGKSQFSNWLMEHYTYNQSIDSLYSSFKNFVQETVDLYESNPYYFISTVQKSIDEAYSKKRRWQDFVKTKKGIKNILTKEELQELKDIIKEANKEANDEIGDPVTLTDRKSLFKRKSEDILNKINERLLKMYGSGAVINVNSFDIKAKPLPKSVAEQYRVGVRTIMRGPRRGRTVNRYSSEYYEALRLNDSLDFLFFSTEQRISEDLSKEILDAKRRMIPALGKNENYKFNKKLLNLTREKFEELLDNVKFNADLLERAIDLQSQKDLEEKIKQSGIPTDEEIKNDISVVTSEQDGIPVELYFYRKYDQLTSTNMEEAINEVKVMLSSKEAKIEYKNKQYQELRNEAIQKRNEILEKSEELKEEVRKTLELESGYFTPLLHYVIQKHIKQAGKDAPMYLAGFNITLLTQRNPRTALIYAGKDEINIVDKNKFELGKITYFKSANSGEFIKNENNLTGDKIISQQEYDKAYQQATERRAKEIKYEAAQKIGLLGSEDVLINPKNLDDSQLEEGIKKLNEYRRKSDQNQDDVITTIFNISQGPIEPGIIYTSMSKIPGVKLVWQPNIEGIQGKTGGYLVDLTNYNFTQEQEYSPYLYGLEAEKEKAPIKPGVEELFNNNPELANEVYQALGYSYTGEYSPAALYESGIKTPDKKDYLTYSVVENKSGKKYINTLNKGKKSTDKGIGKNAYYKFIIENKGKNITTDTELSIAGKKVLEQLEKEGYVTKTDAKVIQTKNSGAGYTLDVYDKPLYEFTDKMPESYLTSEQKQQALQLYNSYLQTTNNPTIEGFKQWNNKQQQVSELFDSSPELANAVYEALGNTNTLNFTYGKRTGNLIDTIEKNKDICLFTQKATSDYLKRNNINSQPFILFKVQSPLTSNKIAHTLTIVKINDTTYFYDMPQSEFIKPTGNNVKQGTVDLVEGVFEKDYKPYLIEVNKENLINKYGISENDVTTNLETVERASKRLFNNKVELNEITPQQKQQAQQLYSSYLEQNPNGSVEQFKSWVDEFNNSDKKDYSLIKNITSLKEGDFIQEGSSVAKIINIDEKAQSFDFVLIDDLNNVEKNNYNWYKDFFETGKHKIKKASKKNIEKFIKSEQILNTIYDKNKNVAKSSRGSRFIANFLGNIYTENKKLTEYLNNAEKINPLDVLTIIENTDNEFKYVAKIIKDVIINNNYEIDITQNDLKEGVAGDYIDGKINMYIPFNDSQYTRVIIHELLHAISDNNTFQFKIDKLYNYVTKFLKDNNIDYGLKNNREFLAEIFSNKTFQELMAQLEYTEPNQNKKLSVLDKFLELLSSFFKIENNSVLKEAFLILEDITKYNNLNSSNKNQDLLWSKKINELSNFISQKSQENNSFKTFQQSLNKPNTNPILQGNQQEQVKKFAELQERLNNKEFLEGAKPAKPEVAKPTYVQGNLFEQKVNQKIEDYLATETSEDVPLEEKKPVPAETREQAIQDVVVKLKNLLTRLGITVKEFEEIYIEQQNINALTNKLQDTTLSEKERADIESQIQALKNKGLDKRALAVADMMNRTINISVDGKIEDLTEEVLHFIVDIIEQKDPALYKELYDKVWSYEKYKEVKKDYAGRYTTEEEFRKEAITQVLNDYLLNPLESAPESDYQNQKTESFWDKIVNKLNSLFTKTPNVDVNPFKIATEKLMRSDFITASDIQYLNSKGLFFSLKKQKSAEEIRDDLLKTSKEMSIKENKEKQPRYFKGTREIAKRVSDLVSKYYSTLFRDTDRKDYAFAEQVREEGVEIHSIFQHTFAKYVSPNGEVLSSPVAANQQLKDLTAKYPNIASKVDEVVREIIRLNPDSYFLTELMIADGYEIGGTLDLVVINKKNGRTSIYDWKTKRGKKQDKGTKSYIERTKIDWWNVNGWRIQLSEYVKILRKNGITNIGDVRMIPIMTFEKKQNDQWKIDTIEITSFERSKVDPRKRQLLPVIGLEEKSPYETINKLTEKIRSVINQNIQKIKSDFRIKEDLEEENAVLENIYSILLATDNINSALSSLRSIIEDSKDLANQAVSDLQKVNDLSDAELYQYYQRIESSLSKLKIYFENSKDGVPVFNLINMTEDIYGKTSEKIISEYENLLTQYKEKPTEELKQKIEKQKPAYDVAISLGKINNSLGDVSRKLRQLSGNYFQRYGERKGISDIFGLDLGQSWLGKFANNIRDLYSLNFKTAQLTKSLLLKANSIIADKNKQAANAMYALRDKYLEGKGTVTNLEDLFKNLIYYNEEANDYFLIPEISDDFKKEFFKMKEEFEKGYSQDGNLFFSTPAYKKIKTWLEDNLEMAEWKKDFEEKKERQIKRFEELNSNLKTTDPEQYEVLYNTRLSQIEYYNNILTSPNAWNSLAKFKYANRKKWTSKEYLKLTDIEKEMHKKFISIYSRAEKIGYVQGYKNYYRIPFKLKQTNLLFEKLDPSKAFIVRPEDEVYQSYTRVDPVTGVEIHEIPIRMTNYLPAKEKGKLVKSLDLFQVYLELETNLNRFEEMSNIEDILLDLIKVEQNKTEEIEINMFGKPTGEKPEKEKAGILTTTREDILKKLIYNALYGIKYEKDIYIRTSLGSLKGTITKNPAELKEGTKYVSVKKAYEWINTYANMLFIQANLKISGAAAISSSIVAGTGTSKNIQGSKYLLSLLNKINPKAKGKSYGKAFNYHLKQREIEELNLQRTETLKRLALYGKQYAVDHLRLVDQFIQNSVFDASLEKFLVINNKIVNADTYFSSLIPDQENMSYKEIKEKEAELYKKHEKDTLLNYLENNTKNGKTDISKLDKDSVYEFEQTIRLESKKIVGNSSDETIFGMRLGFVGSALMKFKSWMPELYNSFFGGIYWREEGKRFEAGRFGSFYRTVVDPINKSNLSKDDKSLLKTMSMGVLNSLNMLFNLGFFGGKQDAINRLEERYRFYREELEELGVENIPTKKEYIDLNLQEAQNAKNFLMSVAVVYLFSNVLAILAGDDDPEEHPNTVRLFELMGLNLGEADDEILKLIFGFASSITGKGLKELYSYYDPEDTYTNLMKLGFPALGAISVGAKGLSATPKLLFGETEDVKNIPDAIPFLRPALRTYIKYSDDEELQDLLNVDKNFRKQRKEDEQAEAWF